MIPKEFEEQNIVYAKDQPEYHPLPAYKSPEGEVVTCWQLSEDEISQIKKTGELWIKVNTFNTPLQPIFMSTNKEDLFIK